MPMYSLISGRLRTLRANVGVACIGTGIGIGVGVGMPVAVAQAQEQASMATAPVLTTGQAAEATPVDAETNAIVEPAKKFSISFEPAVWFAGVGGDLKLPRGEPPVLLGTAPGTSSSGANGEADINDLGFDDPQTSAFGEANIGYGRYRFNVRGVYFSHDDTSTVSSTGSIGEVDYAPSDTLTGSLDFLLFEVKGGYRVYELAERPRQNGDGYVFRFYADVMGGARLYNVDWTIDREGVSNSTNSFDDSWIEPTIGGKLGVTLYEQIDIDLEVNVGAAPFGDHSSSSWDAMLGFTWRPIENLGVQIGFRNISFNLENGDGADEFAWDGALAGLFAGVVLKF